MQMAASIVPLSSCQSSPLSWTDATLSHCSIVPTEHEHLFRPRVSENQLQLDPIQSGGYYITPPVHGS